MIKEILKKDLRQALTFPVDFVRRYKAKTLLSQLTSHESDKLKAVGNALNEVLCNTMENDENKMISLIEKRRSFLLRSSRNISVIDYGAGKPNLNRTREEMERGIQTIRSVADICKASKSAFWSLFLFKLIRKLQPVSCVELGSCVGISAAYQGAALKLNGKGHLTTLEGSPEIAKIAENTLRNLSLNNTSVVVGRFNEKLKGVLESSQPVDCFFNDGHHDHDAVIEYLNMTLPYLDDEAIVVIDDISWSPGMRRAWCEIEDRERVAATIDFRVIGVAFIGDGSKNKLKFKIPL